MWCVENISEICLLSDCHFNFVFLIKSQDTGHLSYACPKNILGEREPPKKKEKKKKKKDLQSEHV